MRVDCFLPASSHSSPLRLSRSSPHTLCSLLQASALAVPCTCSSLPHNGEFYPRFLRVFAQMDPLQRPCLATSFKTEPLVLFILFQPVFFTAVRCVIYCIYLLSGLLLCLPLEYKLAESTDPVLTAESPGT